MILLLIIALLQHNTYNGAVHVNEGHVSNCPISIDNKKTTEVKQQDRVQAALTESFQSMSDQQKLWTSLSMLYRRRSVMAISPTVAADILQEYPPLSFAELASRYYIKKPREALSAVYKMQKLYQVSEILNMCLTKTINFIFQSTPSFCHFVQVFIIFLTFSLTPSPQSFIRDNPLYDIFPVILIGK